MLKRLILGLLKGLALGGAIGAAVYFGVTQPHGLTGFAAYALYALVGALAGITSGKGFWVKGAWVESTLKGLFGLLVGGGLYALASAFLKMQLPIAGSESLALSAHPLVMAPGIAALFAALIELDNTGEAEPEPKSGVRIRSIDDIKVDDEEEDEAAAAKGAAKGRR